MKSTSFRLLAAMTVFALLTGVQAQTGYSVTEQADGSVAIVMEEQRFVISASVAQEVELAVNDHADDPEALRQAIGDIVGRNAADAGQADLATAIAALAVFYAGPDSSSVAAIGLGVTEGNPAVSGAAVIAAIPALRSEPSAAESEEQEMIRAQATVENPAQISPVQ